MQTLALNYIAVDLYTDAMDLFELNCYSKSLPNDKHHRVGILALREDRFTRRIRNILHIPTGIMLADPLTKSVVTKTFMRWVTTGTWLTTLDAKSTSKIRIRRAVRRPATYTEHDLVHNDFTPDDGTFGDQLQLNEAFYQALDFVDDLKLGTFLMQTDITIFKPSGSSSSSAAPPAVQHDEPHDEFLVTMASELWNKTALVDTTFLGYSS